MLSRLKNKQFWMNYILIIVTFFSFTLTATQIKGTFEVDINQEFSESSAFENYDDRTSYYRLGKNLIFSGLNNDGFRELYALDTDKDEIVLLFKKFYDKNTDLKFTQILIKPYSNSKFIVQALAKNYEYNFFITDGTLAGTNRWVPVFSLTHILENPSMESYFYALDWKNENEEYYYHFGQNIYKYDATSNENSYLGTRPKIGSPTGTNTSHRLRHTYFHSSTGKKHLFELIDFNKSMLFDDFKRTPVVSNPENMYFQHKVYFTYTKDDKSYFAYFDAESGFTDLVLLEDIPKCNQSIEIASEISDVVEKNNYIYFKNAYENNHTCIYRLNKQSGDIKIFSDTQLGYKYIKIFAANDKGLIIKGNLLKNNINLDKALMDLFQVDFTQDSIIPLFSQTSSLEKSITLIQGGDDYLFAYVLYACDLNESCDRKSLFRLDVQSFTKETIGGRWDFTTRTGDVSTNSNFFNRYPIYQGKIYLNGKFPYPGLYTTSPEIKHFKPILLRQTDQQTESSRISSSYAIDNGWLLRSDKIHDKETFDAVRYYGVTYDGERYEIKLDYGTRPYVWYESGDTAYITTRRDNLFAINLEDFTSQEIQLPDNNDVINIINDLVLSRSGSIWTITDLKSDNVYEIENEVVNQVFTCSSKLYFTAGNSQNNKLIQINNGKLTTILGESEQLSIHHNTLSTDKLVVNYEHDVKVFDCASESLTTVFSASLPETHSLLGKEVYFNKFNNNAYFIWKGSLYELSLEDNEYQIIYNEFSPNISLSRSWKPIFTVNNIYLKHSLSNSLFMIKNGEILKVFDSRPEDSDTTIRDYQVSGNGKYLYGEYSTMSGDFVIKHAEPFIFDTETVQMHVLDLSPGIAGSVQHGRAVESGGFIAFERGGIEKSNEVLVLDIECILDQICVNTVVNRVPIVQAGEDFFYETGDLVNILFRASDPDLEPLQYQLKNQPDWLSIDSNGLIHGLIPDDVTGIFENIDVIVSDAKSETTALPYTLNITSRNRSPISYLNSLAEIKLKTGEDYSLYLYPYIEDVDGDPLILSLSPSIEGITLDQQGNLIINNAPAGNHTVQISISDSVSKTTTSSISIIIEKESSSTQPPVATSLPSSADSGGGSFGGLHIITLLVIIFRKKIRLKLRHQY